MSEKFSFITSEAAKLDPATASTAKDLGAAMARMIDGLIKADAGDDAFANPFEPSHAEWEALAGRYEIIMRGPGDMTKWVVDKRNGRLLGGVRFEVESASVVLVPPTAEEQKRILSARENRQPHRERAAKKR